MLTSTKYNVLFRPVLQLSLLSCLKILAWNVLILCPILAFFGSYFCKMVYYLVVVIPGCFGDQ